MKKILTITLISFALLFVGYSFIVDKNEDTVFQKNESSPEEKLTFDVDLSSLNYELPAYTKICIPEVKHFCSDEGCETTKPSVFILYDKNKGLLYRCDEKPCDVYEVNEYPSGMFTYLRPKDAKEFSVKIADDPIVKTVAPEMENKYIEIAGTGLGVMVSNGTCK
jgi:hypothetical protein